VKLPPRQIVLALHGWASAAEDQGLILMEYMSGMPLDEAFEEMNSESRAKTLEEVAWIFKSIQEYALPDSIRGLVGLVSIATVTLSVLH
jgi:hypothetical protein